MRREMRASTLKLTGVCAIAVMLGGGFFVAAILKNEPAFVLLGFASLLPFQGCVRGLLSPVGSRDQFFPANKKTLDAE